MRWSRPVAALLVGLGALGGCGGDDRDAITVPPGPVRLIEVLDLADVRSPLTAIEPASAVEDLESVEREEVFAEDFEVFDPVAAKWPMSGGASIEEEAGNRSFGIRELRGGGRYSWFVPARPLTWYVFERKVKDGADAGLDFVVIERTARRLASSRARDSFAEIRLRRHELPAPPDDGRWHRDAISFLTSASTHSLTIELRVRSGSRRADVRWQKSEDAAPRDRVFFDDLRLVRLTPDPDQTLALLAASAAADVPGAPRGIAKRGRFPPLRAVKERVLAQDVNHSWRDALYAPPATDLGFPLALGDDVSLYFSVALWDRSGPRSKARFEVVVREGDDESVLWSKSLEADGEQWRWHDARVALAGYAGRQVDLVLRTRTEAGNPQPVWGSPVLDAPPDGGRPRNVILIAVDTLRADRMSCYGYERPTSPNLDAFAEDAVRFENCLANANWTCPSFASIFTGLVPARHGVLMYGPSTPLPQRLDTIAEHFRRNGWATEAIVYKIPLYNGGYEQGFDVALNVPRFYVNADSNLEKAMAWLQANRERRNFLFLHFNDPHQPFTQPPPFDRRFGDPPREHGIKMPVNVPLGKDVPRDDVKREVLRRLYDGEVAFVDDRIGAFLAALKRAGSYDDTVIGFVSDHGEQFWERGLFGHGAEFMHDEVVRVPLMVKTVAGGPAGEVVRTQVRGFDVMPTLLELAGIEVPEGLDAQSLVPLFGSDDVADRRAIAESSFGSLALRTREWKYVRWLGPQNVPSESLYDLRVDPGEKEDLIGRRPEVAERMRTQVMDYWLSSRPGTYLVSIAADGSADGVALVENVTAARALLGPVPDKTAEGSYSIRGEVRGRIEFVTDLLVDAGGRVTLNGVETPVDAIARYRPGDLDRLLAGDETAMLLFRGPPAATQSEARPEGVDLQQLEALRELGYTGR